jgi:hypothetical protein
MPDIQAVAKGLVNGTKLKTFPILQNRYQILIGKKKLQGLRILGSGYTVVDFTLQVGISSEISRIFLRLAHKSMDCART